MKFRNWVREQKPKVLAPKLGLDRSAIYLWLTRNSMPRPLTMQQLVKLGEGAFDYNDIIEDTRPDSIEARGIRGEL